METYQSEQCQQSRRSLNLFMNLFTVLISAVNKYQNQST